MKAFLTTRDALIFLFFLICSAIFWLTITLNKTYELSVEFPIEYVNIPPELEFTTELPDSFSVKLKDKGTSMLAYQYKEFDPVIINFSEYSVYSNSNSWSISTTTHFEKFVKKQINLLFYLFFLLIVRNLSACYLLHLFDTFNILHEPTQLVGLRKGLFFFVIEIIHPIVVGFASDTFYANF